MNLLWCLASYRGCKKKKPLHRTLTNQFRGTSPCPHNKIMHPEYVAAYRGRPLALALRRTRHIGAGATGRTLPGQGQRHPAARRSVSAAPRARSAPKRIPTYPPRRSRRRSKFAPVPARTKHICEGCHTPARFMGEKLLVSRTSRLTKRTPNAERVGVLQHLGGPAMRCPT